MVALHGVQAAGLRHLPHHLAFYRVQAPVG